MRAHMKIHTIPGAGYSGNIFLLDSEKPVLVDTGWDADIVYPAKTLDAVLEGRKLDRIVLTHRHIDHVGGAMAFQKRYGGVIYAHELDAPPLMDGDQESTGARMFGSHIDPMPVEVLNTGDIIEMEDGGSLKVLHTPGHTTGSICLFSTGGHLFSGDTVFTSGGVGRWDFPTGSLEQLKESLAMLAELDITGLYPGHGPHAEFDGLRHIRLGLDYLRMVERYV